MLTRAYALRRRLSDALGRDTVMVYRHVPNKAAGLDGVA